MTGTERDKIVLASASPRRSELLQRMRVCFEVLAADVDEAARAGEVPAGLAARLAEDKAKAVHARTDGATVIAADTLVALDEHVLGKPRHAQEAEHMLTRLRGRWHDVYTGLAVIAGGQGSRRTVVARTPVLMRSFTDEEMAAYIASGDPLDKAGAYAIQHDGFAPVERIGGCYANVMGLPMCHLYRELLPLVREMAHPIDCCPYAVEHGGCRWSQAILDAR